MIRARRTTDLDHKPENLDVIVSIIHTDDFNIRNSIRHELAQPRPPWLMELACLWRITK